MQTTTSTPRTCRGFTAIALAALGIAFVSTPAARAAISQSNATGVASGFTVSATDLVNQGRTTLTSATRSHKPEHSTSGDFGGYDPANTGLNVPYANDGAIGAFSTSPWGKNVEYYPMTSPTSAYPLPVTYTFTLNTTLNPAGYDISGITSTCGYLWNNDWMSNQVFQVEITKDNGSTWLNLGTYTYAPYPIKNVQNAKLTQVTLASGGAALDNGTYVAQHVTGIRITYSDTGIHGDFDGTAIKEIDVLGQASAAYVVDAGTSTVVASPTSVASDGVTTSTVTVTLKDAGGVAIPGKTVTLASSRTSTDTISAASGVSSASGVVTFTVKSSTAGSSEFTATDTTDSVIITEKATVTFLAAAVSAANSTVAASPTLVTADGSTTSTVTVTVKDSSGTAISGKTVTLASSRGATDTISTASGASDASGVVTFTVKSSTAGTPVFTATADSVAITQTASVTFTAGAVSAGTSTVVASPATVPADGTATSTVTVTLLDANSNPVIGKIVTLVSSRLTDDTISAASGSSSASGVVTFTVTSLTAGSSVFTATDSTDSVALSPTPTVTFTAVSAANSTVAASPTSVAADGSTTSTITVTLKDASGNPFAGKAVSLAHTSGPGTPVIATVSGTTSASGVATFTVKSVTVGADVFTATDTTDSVTVTQTATVTFAPLVIVQTNSSTNTSSAGSAAGGFTASATDLVNQGQTTLSAASRSHVPLFGDPAGSNYHASNAGSAPVYVNDGQIGDFSVSPWGKNVELFANTTASGWVTTNMLLPVTYTFTLNTSLNPSGYDISNITSTCGWLWNRDCLADQKFQVEITKDGSTWLDLGTYSYIPVTNTSSASGTFETQVVLSNLGGSALNTGTHVAKNVRAIRVTYLSTNVLSPNSDIDGTAIKELDVFGQASAPYVVDAGTSTVTASPTSIASDGVTTSTVTVTLKDAGGNPIPGKTVTLASSRTSTDTISAASGASDASGVVTFTVKSSTAGAAVFTATDTTDSVTVTQTATVNFISDAVSAANSTVTASPTTVAADGSTTSTVTVTLMNADSNPLSGKTVTLASSRTSTDTISAASGDSDASGVVTFTVKSTTAGSPVFSATGDSVALTQTATVTFTAGAVSAGTSTVVAAPATVPADGTTTSTVTVTLLDANSNPVAGKTVTLASSRTSTDTISAASGVSSASGVVTFTVKSLTAGSSVFTATGDSVALSTTPGVTFAPLVIVQNNASGDAGGFTVSATDLVNQGQATLSSATRSHVPLHSTSGDFGGYDPNNTGLNVPYANDGAIGAMSGSPWGQNVEYFPSTQFAGTQTPANELLPVTYIFTLNTTLNPAGYDLSGLTSTCGYLWNSDWTANQVFQVEITKDGSTWLDLGTYTYKPYTTDAGTGNKVSQVALSNAGGALNNGTDVAKNVRAIRITYSDPGNTSGFTGTAIKEIDVAGVPSAPLVVAAGTSTVTASPTTVANDGVSTSTITVALKDAAGIPVVGKTVTLASSRTTTDTISPASGISNGSGVVTFSVKSTTAGMAEFTATDVTDSNLVIAPSTASVTFSATAVSVVNSTVTTSPATVTADGTSTSTVTVTLKNVGNAGVTGQTVTLASSRGASDTISPASGISDASGVVTFTVKSTTMGVAVFTASVTGDNLVLTQTATVNFIAGAVHAAHSTVTATPSSVLADGVTTAAITVTLMDANNNPVAGKSVTLARNGNTGTGNPAITTVAGTTSAAGVATFTVACITAGTYDFQATDITDSNLLITQAATVVFAAGSGNIMPMGDSITLGVPVAGGYRDLLYTLLHNRGDSFTFVGSLTDNATQTLTDAGQTHHEGHSGYVIAAGGGRPGLDENLETWIGPGAAAPDKILLMIGSNDIDLGYDMSNAPTRLSTLITHIYDYRPNVKLYVASIIPMTGHEANVQAFNATIPGIVASHQALGRNVVYVPMYEAMNINTDLVDGLHPNALGYQHMAQAWDTALHPLPYTTWANGTFANAFTDKTTGGDPDSDSLTNLQEYAFNTDPTTGTNGSIAYTGEGLLTACGPPDPRDLSPGTGGVDFRAVFCRRKNWQAEGLTYTVQFSADLDFTPANSQTVTMAVGTATVLATDAVDVMEAVSVPYPLFIPVTGGYKKPTFFRVGVSSN